MSQRQNLKIRKFADSRREKVKKKNENHCKTVIFQLIQMKFGTQIRNQNRHNLKLFLEEIKIKIFKFY